jgi:cytoskeleton protein RodZ
MSLGVGEHASPASPEAAPATALQTPGALLQQERVRRGLSVQQAAEGLHLDAWMIEAIESNQFLALGAPVYAKGYLRKYAALLELAPDVIVARYDGLSDTPVVPTPIPVITTTPPRPKWPKYLGWTLMTAAVIGIGVLAYTLVVPHLAPAPGVSAPPAPVESTPAPSSSQEPQASVATSTGMNETETAQVVVPETRPVAAPPAAAPPVREAAPAAAPPTTVADGSSVQVRLEFSEASWIEVYDATGNRLLYEVGQPGRSRVVSGVAPLNVVVGLASAVSVQVGERTIVVPRRANKDSTRFTIGADGAVQ